MTIKLEKSSADFRRGFIKCTEMILKWCEAKDIKKDHLVGMLESTLLLYKQMEEEATNEK